MRTRCAPMSYAMSPRTSPECHRHKESSGWLVHGCHRDVTGAAQRPGRARSRLSAHEPSPRRRRRCPATRAGTAPARSKDAKFGADAARLVATSDSPSGDDDRSSTRAPHGPSSPRSSCRRRNLRPRTPGLLPGDPRTRCTLAGAPAGPVLRTAKPAPGFRVGSGTRVVHESKSEATAGWVTHAVAVVDGGGGEADGDLAGRADVRVCGALQTVGGLRLTRCGGGSLRRAHWQIAQSAIC
jgi:hypothetical protein